MNTGSALATAMVIVMVLMCGGMVAAAIGFGRRWLRPRARPDGTSPQEDPAED